MFRGTLKSTLTTLLLAACLRRDGYEVALFDATFDPPEEGFRQALERLMENRTTFIIAHRIQSVMKADLIVVLDKGRIIQIGTHEELLSQEGVYRKIYDIQTQIEAELEKEVASADLAVK